jgi:hypothetical protein
MCSFAKGQSSQAMLFRKEIPEGFLRQTLKLLHLANSECLKAGRHLAWGLEQYKDHFGQMRRGTVEAAWKRFAEEVKLPSSKVEVGTFANSRKSGHHVRVQIGRIVMTVHQVNSPKDLVRFALHREVYADDFQLELFAPEKRLESDLVYAQLLWGPSITTSRNIDFFEVAFPNRENDQYIDSFDLMYLDSDNINDMESAIEPIAEPNPVIKIPKVGDS